MTKTMDSRFRGNDKLLVRASGNDKLFVRAVSISLAAFFIDMALI